ncbi:MAG: peptide-methionine (S)-S-oxide reductase MsrA [bacterium]|nr:peptide-methionine (S)-S-oxide reductase MsrA [bacterium]
MLGKITLGGGCFWCLEAVFKNVKGITNVVPGYSGGYVKFPTYEQGCSGQTGHAEDVDIEFDDSVISLEEILEIFFFIHDPTTKNRQGNDIGTQYRSIIFYRDNEQKRCIEQYIRELKKMEVFKNYENDEIVTEISEFKEFFPAEEYHHNYFERNLSNPYCLFVISPKLEEFKNHYKKKIEGR